MFDTHVHSTFSPDSISTIAEYVKKMSEIGLQGIGFCEHLDFLPECGAYGFLNFGAYKNEVLEFRNKGYNLKYGAEVDFAKCVTGDILERVSREKYDFLTCSIHMINGFAVSDRSGPKRFSDLNNFREILKNYYLELKACLDIDIFDVVAHAGVYKRYLSVEELEAHPLKAYIDEMDEETAELTAQSNKLLEVNTSGFFAKFGNSLPDEEFLKKYYQHGGRRLSLGSDAHNVNDLGRGLERAIEMIKNIGFKYIYLPWDKENPIKV